MKNKMENIRYKECIEACYLCVAACLNCARMDLKESHHDMGRCTQLDMECATICNAAAQLMSLGSEHANHMCRLCVEICRQCAEECEKHDEEHCKRCAEACRKCEEACRKMAA